MKRFVSIWLPTFAIDRMREATHCKTSKIKTPASISTTENGLNSSPIDDRVPTRLPFALVQSSVRGLVITAINERARVDGIVIGQPLADARAAFPHLLTRPAEPHLDRARLLAFANAVGRYGPARNVEGRDGLWIDITGVAHLFGSEDALAQDIRQHFARAGYRTRIGIAQTLAAAFAFARHAPQADIVIAPSAKTAMALSGLPVEALRLEQPTVVLLKRLGLRRIGQLYNLPRTVLTRRFRDIKRQRKAKGDLELLDDAKLTGNADARAFLAQAVVQRLDQALGRAADPRTPLVQPPAFVVRRSYPDILITSEGIETACQDLARALCKQLSRNHQGVRRLRFSLYRADGSVAELLAGTSRPCRTPEHLITLFQDKLVRLDVGFGVDMIALEALQIECLHEMQTQFATHDTPDAIDLATVTAALVDRLQNRLGVLQVSRLETAPSHIPERGQVRVTDFSRKPLVCGRLGCAILPRHRPMFLFPSPERITVVAEVPEGPPSRFTWRRVAHRITKAEGPERIAPEWWRHLGQTNSSTDRTQMSDAERIRDYYRLEDESGTQYWVFRSGLYQREAKDGPPFWYIHGLFG